MWWYLAGAVFFIAAACLFIAGPDTENPAPETPGPEKTENLDQSARATRSLTGQALSITLIHRQPNEPCYGR